ncbi:uncharacterized protein METZ01_LOCUS295198, partial [marine metagenome]
MKNGVFVKYLYVTISIIFMISCEQRQVTIFSNCVIPSYPSANS